VEKKRLTKSKTEKKIFGVCGGIAEYLDCDPTIVRLIWAGSVILFGVGVIGYLAAALILPEDKNI
jgi:phage shock protein PspC (stress-responsive transcriptional regulator)